MSIGLFRHNDTVQSISKTNSSISVTAPTIFRNFHTPLWNTNTSPSNFFVFTIIQSLSEKTILSKHWLEFSIWNIEQQDKKLFKYFDKLP